VKREMLASLANSSFLTSKLYASWNLLAHSAGQISQH